MNALSKFPATVPIVVTLGLIVSGCSDDLPRAEKAQEQAMKPMAKLSHEQIISKFDFCIEGVNDLLSGDVLDSGEMVTIVRALNQAKFGCDEADKIMPQIEAKYSEHCAPITALGRDVLKEVRPLVSTVSSDIVSHAVEDEIDELDALFYLCVVETKGQPEDN